MTKARTLADFVSSGNPLADGTISVSEVVGAAPLANPTFTGDLTAPEIDLTAIATDISDTAVDVFVYRTADDSDGGKWRKRTQHTSWYNEAASATRGSRKEFPSVAVIVLENNKLTIYDGDDPDLPMWMVFSSDSWNGGLPAELGGTNGSASAAAMLNGVLVMCSNGTTASGTTIVNFLSDSGQVLTGTGFNFNFIVPVNVSQRNEAGTNTAVSGGTVLASNLCNDVAMTVLPNAPIDAATGLPVPTIAVATDGGVSVIKDDGTVVDITYTSYNKICRISFRGDGSLVYISDTNANARYLHVDHNLPTADITKGVHGYIGTADSEFYYSNTGNYAGRSLYLLKGNLGIVENNSFGNNAGLTSIAPNRVTPTEGMVAYTTSSYNTGWQVGAIKLATLSDTDTANVTGAELVTNGTFASNTTGWTAANSATVTHQSGRMRIAGNVGTANQAITTVVGKSYTVSADLFNGTSSSSAIYVSTTASTAQSFTSFANPNKSVTFTANATTTYIIARVNAATNTYIEVDNVSVRLAEEDRSVNNNGLQVFGTVTKTAVATGADLVAYSGFSSGNYLQQPYNSDLDFGTGDFSVTFWFNGSGGGNTNLWERGAATGQNFGILTVNGYIYLTGFGANIPIGSPHANAGDASWGHVVLLREAGVWGAYLNGEPVAWAYTNAATLTNTAAVLHLGGNVALTSFANAKKLALMRFSATIPTAAQVAKIYNDEKYLFQENAQATLYGSSDAVTALAHDDTTDLLHVGTSAGRSVFQGLRRVENTTDAVGAAISASNGLVVEE